MDIITTSIIWLIALLCHKYYKDSIIKRYRERLRILEDTWTKEPKEK